MKLPRRPLLLFVLSISLILISPLSADHHLVTIRNKELSVTLAEKGAELQSIKHNSTGIEYLWQGDPEYWAARSPNMFPVNVRFKDDKFTYQNIPYEMPRMGLAVVATFETTEHTEEKKKDRTSKNLKKELSESKVVQVLNSSEETLQYYPFPFQLKITSQLKGLTLLQKYKITNTGEETLYFALGGHPGFNAPLGKSRDRSDYEYVFSDKMELKRNEIVDSLIQESKVDFLNKEDRLALSDERVPNGGMFLLENESRKIGIALKGRKPYVTVDLGDFPNTNLWSPPGMPYAAIEPMVSHHDFQDTAEAIEEKDYLIELLAGKSGTYEFSITINPVEGQRALGK
jgi:galactose mutarotase-like enzyme